VPIVLDRLDHKAARNRFTVHFAAARANKQCFIGSLALNPNTCELGGGWGRRNITRLRAEHALAEGDLLLLLAVALELPGTKAESDGGWHEEGEVGKLHH
jgi:hypothetical protein